MTPAPDGNASQGDPGSPPPAEAGGSAGQYAGLGIQMAISIIVFLYLGQWLDRRLGTRWFVVLGVLVGAAASFYSMYRKLTAAQAREEAARTARRPPPP